MVILMIKKSIKCQYETQGKDCISFFKRKERVILRVSLMKGILGMKMDKNDIVMVSAARTPSDVTVDL